MACCKRVTLVWALVFAITSGRAHADSASREFIMSCTYGVLAGTLVGLATLAFTNKPGEHKYRVARGASLGLYAGIILGLYVVYGVSDPNEEPDDGLNPGESWRLPKALPTWALVPNFTDERLDGASFVKEIYRF